MTTKFYNSCYYKEEKKENIIRLYPFIYKDYTDIFISAFK